MPKHEFLQGPLDPPDDRPEPCSVCGNASEELVRCPICDNLVCPDCMSVDEEGEAICLACG